MHSVIQHDGTEISEPPLPPHSWSATLHQIVSILRREGSLSLDLTPHAGPFSQDMAAAIAVEVSYFADLTSPAGTALVATLGDIAKTFAEALTDDATSYDHAIAQQLRDLGFEESFRGATPETFYHLSVSLVRHLWRLAHNSAVRLNWPSEGLGRLGIAISSLHPSIEKFLLEGHDPTDLGANTAGSRTRLIWHLLAAHPDNPASLQAVATHSARAHWPLPAKVTVFRLRHPISHDELSSDILVDHIAFPTRVITSHHATEGTLNQLALLAPTATIAVSDSVGYAEARGADQRALRALWLAESGILRSGPVIRCDQVAVELWLHAEPELRRNLAQELLAPLLAEGPNSRMVLAETMLAWLTTRESAPTIAERLGVHPQTVRYRWRRLHQLYGDQLRDPEFTSTIALVLRATLPLWAAGDHRDAHEYREAARTAESNRPT